MGDVTQMPPRSPLDRPPEGEKKRGTLAEFEWMLAESGVTVQFDVVRKRQIVEVPGAVTTAENSAETMRAYIVDLCKRHGYPVGQIDGYLVAVADRHAVNPVMDWIDSIPWDGESRYGDLLDTLGFYGPDGREHGCMLLRRWMISAVAAVSDPVTTRAKGVLVLQGPQDCGKTQWLERLGAEWFLEGHILDPHDKDTMISAAEHWIVELGEIDATFRRADIAAIKSYLGKREDESDWPTRIATRDSLAVLCIAGQ